MKKQSWALWLLLVLVGCETTREKYVHEHQQELASVEKQTILQGKLYLGMPKEAVLASIGRPTRVNADFLGHQVFWYYDYDRSYSTRHREGILKTTFVVELRDDKVYNWRED